MSPLFDKTVQRERLFNQDTRLVDAAAHLATAVCALPRDPKYAEIQPRALLVGGYVRDALIGGHPKDLDVEVYGVSPDRLRSLLEQLFPEKVNLVGEAFGILKIRLDNDVEFDVSIPRRESKTAQGHRGFETTSDPAMTVEDAARRRDFTMNAISADPLTGEVFDPFQGLKDLDARVLRVTDVERFQDDPLRVYRAIQFAARLNLDIEPHTTQLLREMVERGDLDTLPKERITEELRKIYLKAERPSIGFACLRELGIVEKYYPELHALIGTPQEPEWHPEGDVWIHTMMVVDEAAKIIRREDIGSLLHEEERLGTMIGALCHDLGKPGTTRIGEKDGVPRIRSLGHEEAGEVPTRTLLDKWKFGEAIERTAIAMAREHLKPGMLYLQRTKGTLTPEQYVNAVRKFLKRIHPVSWRVALAVSEADFRGRALPDAQTAPFKYGQALAEVVQEHHLDKEPAKPLLRGQDLIDRGEKPGSRLGMIIKEAETLRDDGMLATREEALTWLDQRLAKRD